MNQKIYNALRQLEGYTVIDVGDGFVFNVWLDWKNQPHADLSDCADDQMLGIGITCVNDKDSFEKSKHTSGFRKEVISLLSIKSINGTPIEKRITA